MEPFIDLLQQLHRGVPMDFWPEMLRDIRVYAWVGSDGLGFALWPKWPITIEGTVFDREHPILVREYGRGTLRLVEHQWERGSAPLRNAS
jgi:hypothetical protein